MMKQEEINEILTCLSGDRTVFHYFKDRYCLDLLRYHIEKNHGDAVAISELNRGKLSRFGSKPVLKNIIKNCGSGYLYSDDICAYWPSDFLTFVLTLDQWGDGDRGWDQTTRNQKNLVLQLNFDNQHISEYRRLLKPNENYGPFEFWGHPVREDSRKTMSWVRIDLDFSSNEALIEEIQNDWLRNVYRSLSRVKQRLSTKSEIKPGDVVYGIDCDYKELAYYSEQILKPYNQLWAEASMLAAINFIRNELGINTIYYHSFDTGRKIKKIGSPPPRSMYTQLPRQFGFELTDEAPLFIQRDKRAKRYVKAIKNPQWYRLVL